MRSMPRIFLLLLLGGCATSSSDHMGKADPVVLRKQLARSLLAHREWAAAVTPLLEVKAVQPKDPEVHTLLGLSYREQGLYDEGEAEFKTAIALDSKQAEAYAGLGVLRDLRGDTGDAALEDHKKAIALSPERPAFYNNYGFSL